MKDKINQDLITIGFHKGEMDFGVNGSVGELNYRELSELRQMIVVAIYVAEDMWRREQSRKEPVASKCADEKI